MTAQQLKNSILQMAVQGKLVPQDPTDEPASVLLERIRAEKEEMIKAGKIKREKNPSRVFRGPDNLPYEQVGKNEPVCIAEEVPFEIPESWEWCRVGDLFTSTSGLSYKKESLSIQSDSMIRVLRGGNIGEEEYFFNDDDVFISREFVKPDLLLKKGYMITPSVSSIDHIGKIVLIYQNYDDVVAGGFVLMLKPFFDDMIISQYLLYEFAAKHHRDNCKRITHKSGQAFYNLSREKLMNLPVPIPPKDEMSRIIGELDKLRPCIAQYGVLECRKDFLDKNFPICLKKSILQQAVQGKLVPQDSADEPASVLLEHIRAEKEHLICSGKIKRDKHESVIYKRDKSYYEKLDGVERCIDDEIPFEIPESWEWVRLGNISDYGGKKEKVSIRNVDPDLWELNLEDIEKGGNLLARRTVRDQKSVGDKTIFRAGELLYSKLRPYLLKIMIAPEDGICTSEIVPFSIYGGIVAEYIVNYLKSPSVDFFINSITYGTKMPRVGTETMTNLLVSIPSLSEQHRIVQKIEELLSTIDTL